MRISDWSSDVCSSDLSISSVRKLRLSSSSASVNLKADDAAPVTPIRTRSPVRARNTPTNANRDAGWENFTRSEEHTSELQSLMRISYAVFCLKKKKKYKLNQKSTR